MKNLILFLFLAISVQATSSNKYGYLIVVTGSRDIQTYKVESITRATEIFNMYFNSISVALDYQLKYSAYFQILTENKGFYIERKKITKKGKYRKMSKRDIREYQKSLIRSKAL